MLLYAMMVCMKKLAIIGGGAAGLMAAIGAAQRLRDAQNEFLQDARKVTEASSSVSRPAQALHGKKHTGCADVSSVEIVIYEAADRVGRSILATGNGRCNFSNARIDPSLYHQKKFVEAAFSALDTCSNSLLVDMSDRNPLLNAFGKLGLLWREEGEGRLYPLANKASSVLEVLRSALSQMGVREECDTDIVRIEARGGKPSGFVLECSDGSRKEVDAVVVAVGGRAVSQLELPDNLKKKPCHAVLGPLQTEVRQIKTLNNIRVRCAVSLVDTSGKEKAREQGEILFRDYGVSGIAIFNLSRHARTSDKLVIDFLPQIPSKEMQGFLTSRFHCLADAFQELTYEAFLQGILLPAVARVVLKDAQLSPSSRMATKGIAALSRSLKEFTLDVRGVGDARQCQVMRGGYAVEGFFPESLSSRAYPGLYVVGEALDIDAPCGGYNLHWAWASGMLAGDSAVCALQD